MSKVYVVRKCWPYGEENQVATRTRQAAEDWIDAETAKLPEGYRSWHYDVDEVDFVDA